MSVTDNTIYVIGIDQAFILEDVYDSMEEAIEDIESPDKCHIAFKYTRKAIILLEYIRHLHENLVDSIKNLPYIVFLIQRNILRLI